MSLGSGACEGTYSFESRFGEGDTGTNPEELIAAAHAGCFTMALSLVSARAGRARVARDAGRCCCANLDDRPTITKIALRPRARVPGSTRRRSRGGDAAKKSCVVSRALAGVEEITLDAKLES